MNLRVNQEQESEVAQHSNVRRSHAQFTTKLLSRSIALSELLDWKCSVTCTTSCLGAVKRVESQRVFWLDDVMDLRRITCSFAEQIQSVLKTLLRTSRCSLKYVVCGMEVCKSVFVWAHGFSSSNYNRVHAAFNKDFQKANPLLVRVLLHLCQFIISFVFAAGQRACRIAHQAAQYKHPNRHSQKVAESVVAADAPQSSHLFSRGILPTLRAGPPNQ